MSMRYVKTFWQKRVQDSTDGTFEAPPTDIEEEINAWVDLSGSQIHDVSEVLYRHAGSEHGDSRRIEWTVLYTVTYSQGEVSENPMLEEAQPIVAKGVIPRMPAQIMTPAGRQMIQAQVGVFTAQEGAKFHPDDLESAPLPLLSPAADLAQYGDLFS